MPDHRTILCLARSRNNRYGPVSSYDVSVVPLPQEALHPSSVPDVPGGSQAPEEAARDELDPELLALPDPPRGQQRLTVVVLSIAALLALAMTVALRGDVAYALRTSTPVGVGDLRTASEATLEANENRLVQAEGMLGAAGGIRYERPLVEDTFRTLPVPGRDVWVDVRVPAGQESGRWEPPRTFTGRLVRFASAGPRHRGLAGAIERTTGNGVSPRAWLVVDGEDPSRARWALLLATMFLGFAAWNAVAIARIVRKIR
jgi:hypothetical protein